MASSASASEAPFPEGSSPIEPLKNAPSRSGGDGKPSVRRSQPVVGIGASAGGLEALQTFFGALPADTGMSYVVIVHLNPNHESHLGELLQAKTEMPVTQVQDPVPLEPNHVYVIPPSKRLETVDHTLSVSDFEEPRGRRFPVDHFFRSLATTEGGRIGILFSGGGSDGVVGIKDIKRVGGLVLAQDPEEADHESMPRSAIASGLVDLVLPAAEIAARLPVLQGFSPELPEDPNALTEQQEKGLRQILKRVHFETGHDFSDYKPSTLLPRIRRRMQITQKKTLEDYLSLLRQEDEETAALFRELLVGVSKFFPDPEAFEALKEKVIPEILRGKGARHSVRAWVVGCLTGEETYSVGMLLEESLSGESRSEDFPSEEALPEESLVVAEQLTARSSDIPKIQIFASDINKEGLAVAREGRYPASIEFDVPEKRIQRFFEEEKGLYRVGQSLRDRVVFAPHSVLRDPPFSQIDLVVCRNYVVHLQAEAQRKLFEIFHYALRPQGYLFLGPVDTAEASGLFRAIDGTHGLYQAREHTGERPLLPSLVTGSLGEGLSQSKGSSKENGSSRDRKRPDAPLSEAPLHNQILGEVGPASILVDEDLNAVHLSARAGRYLQHPEGPPTSQVIRLARPELQSALQAALLKAFKEREPTVARPIEVQFDSQARVVYLTVRRAENEDGKPVALVLFNKGNEVPHHSPGISPENAASQRSSTGKDSSQGDAPGTGGRSAGT